MKITNRRQFFKKAGAGVLALNVSPLLFSADLESKMEAQPNQELFKVAVAGYTFRKFDLDATLNMLERVNVHYLCIKDFHLPLNSTAEQITAFHAKLKNKGVTGYAVGPLGMKSESEVDMIFEYCKRAGTKMVVGVPEHALLPYIDRKVREYGFLFAIHNHGYGDKLYPSLDSIYEKVKGLDTRIGMCHDIGYSIQMGFNPAELTIKYATRIHDVHLKDFTEGSKNGKDCELGRGVIDFPSFVKALRKIRYSGMCSLEFEKDPDDPLAGIAESIGYFNGVLRSV